MKILAISGYKRSGKDKAAEHLVKAHGFTRYGFADTLKDMVAEQYNVPRSHFDDPNLKEMPILSMPVIVEDKFGEVLQRFMEKEFRTSDGLSITQLEHQGRSGVKALFEGQLYWTPRALAILEGSVKRTVNSGYWVQKVIGRIRNPSESLQNPSREVLAVISDLRYRSEVKQLREAFGDDLVTVRLDRFDTSPSSDPSERDLDSYKLDATIRNRREIEYLYSELDKLVNGRL